MPCSVDGFQVRYGSPGSAPNQIIDVGRPHQAAGHFSYPLELPDGVAISVCVAAIRGSQTSECSQPLTLDPNVIRDSPSDPAPDEESRLWCDDFLDGLEQPGWVRTGAGNSLQPAETNFGIHLLDGANGALVATTVQPDIHAHFLGSDVEGDSSSRWNRYEYSGQMRFSDSASAVGVTFYSRYNESAAYYRLGRGPSGEFQLERRPVAQNFLCPSAGTGVQPVANTWYAFRVQVQDDGAQATVKAKVWRADEREPEGFTAFCGDSGANRALTGTIGVWSSGAGQKAWDNLSVSELEEPPATDPLGIPGKPQVDR